jgi:hypothetical protein
MAFSAMRSVRSIVIVETFPHGQLFLEIHVVATLEQLDEIDDLMKRRHHIVHRTDSNPKSGRGQHLATRSTCTEPPRLFRRLF